MKASQCIANGQNLWLVRYKGIPGKNVVVREQDLFNLYNL